MPTPKKEDTILALKFFEKLNTLIENKEYDVGDTIMEMIKANPFLLTTKCPREIGEIQEGCNIMEAISSLELGPDTLDFLYNVVLLGGKATDGCYEKILNQSEFPMNEHLAVLILSGYFPTKGPSFFLDQLTDAYPRSRSRSKSKRSRSLHREILHILYKLIKPCDNLDVNSTIIDNINNLPSLKVGVTHSQGGSMDILMKRYESNLKQLAVTEMNLFKLLEEGCKRKNDECISQEGDRKKKQKANAKQFSDKKGEIERVCSICKGSKRFSEFSKKQRGNGAKIKCKDCVASAQKAAIMQQTNSEEKLFEEPPSPEDCRICFSCKATKTHNHFSKPQLMKGSEARCKICVEAMLISRRKSSSQGGTRTDVREAKPKPEKDKKLQSTPSSNIVVDLVHNSNTSWRSSYININKS